MRPRLLDLFCGAGGAAMGYSRAGFDVVGVDIRPQPRYPFAFVQMDALAYLDDWMPGFYFQAIHASPPCQAYSVSTNIMRANGREYPDLLGPTRDQLEQTGLPWVIENVPGAPMRPDFELCGCVFGLPGLRRERWFETSWHGFDMRSPCSHQDRAISVVGHGAQGWEYREGLPIPTQEDRRRAMGIDWMNRDELAEAIPPAYTELIGAQLLAQVLAHVEQLTLVDVEGETKLTPRQQAVLRALRNLAADDGLETSEAGAICHAMKEGRWAHDAESRCVYCSRDGLAILRRLRDLGYCRYRGKLKLWQAVGVQLREPEPPSGMLRDDQPIPF